MLVLKTHFFGNKKLIAASLILLMIIPSTAIPVEAREIRIVDGRGGGTIYPGDVITTDSKSTALITFNDGSKVALKPNSQFVINAPDTFSLSLGEMWAKLQKGLSRNYQVRSPTACACVRGTEFTMKVDANSNATTVVVLEGEVEAQDLTSKSSVLVTANQTIEIPKVPGGLNEQDMQQRIKVFDPVRMERWWEKAKPLEALTSGGDVDLLSDLKLNYTHVWPVDPSGWSLSGIGMYEMTVTVEEKVYVDFTFTYVADEDAQIQVLILNKIPLGMSGGDGDSNGWLHQFDFVNPPTSNTGAMQLISEDPLTGAGYSWSQTLKRGDQLVIKGRMVMVNQTAADLSAQGLAITKQYSNSYMPIADMIVKGDQTQIPSMDIWGTLGIPISKSTIDTVRAMKQQEVSFNQEKTNIQSQLSDLQKTLSSTQEQVKTLQSDLKSAQNSINSAEKNNTALKTQLSSLEQENTGLKQQVSILEKDSGTLKSQITNLEKDKASLQSEVSTKQSDIASLQSQLSQSQTMTYGSAGAAIALLIAAAAIAVRKRK